MWEDVWGDSRPFDPLPQKDLCFSHPAGWREGNIHHDAALGPVGNTSSWNTSSWLETVCARMCMGDFLCPLAWVSRSIMEYKWQSSFHQPQRPHKHKHTATATLAASLPLNCSAAFPHIHTMGLTNTSSGLRACHPKKSPEGNHELSPQFTVLLFHSCHMLPVVND